MISYYKPLTENYLFLNLSDHISRNVSNGSVDKHVETAFPKKRRSLEPITDLNRKEAESHYLNTVC